MEALILAAVTLTVLIVIVLLFIGWLELASNWAIDRGWGIVRSVGLALAPMFVGLFVILVFGFRDYLSAQ